MVVVVTRLPSVPGQPGYGPSFFAPNNTTEVVSGDRSEDTMTQGRATMSTTEQKLADPNPQIERDKDTFCFNEQGSDSQESDSVSLGDMPSLKGLPQLSADECASEAQQPGSPTTRQETRANLASDTPDLLSVQSNRSSSLLKSAGLNGKKAVLVGLTVLSATDKIATSDQAASPASSSADAPGSHYDEDEHEGRNLSMLGSKLEEVQQDQPSEASPDQQDVDDHAAVGAQGVAEAELADDQSAQPRKETGNFQLVSALPMQSKQHVTIQESNKKIDGSGLSEPVDSLSSGEIGEIEHKAAITTQSGDVHVTAMAINPAASSVQLSTASKSSLEQPHSPKSFTRSAGTNENTGNSSKRQKMEDCTSTHEHPVPLDVQIAAAPEKKRPTKKMAKSTAKPRKDPKVRSHKTTTQPSFELETGEQGPVGPDNIFNHPEHQIALPARQEMKIRPKPPRKSTERSRKQQTQVSGAVEQEGHPSQESVEFSGVNVTAIGSLLSNDATIGTVSEQTLVPAKPELNIIKQGKAKYKESRKAKVKTKLVTPDPDQRVAPSFVSSSDPITTRRSKPAMKRATVKSAKGRIAQLRPAQADDAVSELELDSVRRSSSSMSLHAGTGYHPDEEPSTGSLLHLAVAQTEYAGSRLHYGESSFAGQQQPSNAPSQSVHPPCQSGDTDHHIVLTIAPPHYPAQAYFSTRAEMLQQYNRGLSSLSSATSKVESERQWSSEPSVAVPDSSSSTAYGAIHEATSLITVAIATESATGDEVSDTVSLSPFESFHKQEPDRRVFPPGWRFPKFDVIDPDLLMTTMRDSTVWTFWDCYLPLGCRDQDMVMLSNDNVAFPCAAWNPCLFSVMLERVIKNPSRIVTQILQRGVEENRKKLGYKPLPCVWIDENWRATNLLLSFLHPIPSMFLPDYATCRIVLDLGARYGVERATLAATQRMHQLDKGDRPEKDKGKGRAREEDIEADLVRRVA